MDPKLLFWAAALANLGVLCGFGLFGVSYARRGEIARHRRNMKAASFLIVAFLASYALKVVFLGREDQSSWSSLDVWVLRIHELFVVIMLVAGIVAWRQASGLEGTSLVTRDASDPAPDARVARRHRVAGWTAVASAILGFLMAIGVFAGMVVRSSS